MIWDTVYRSPSNFLSPGSAEDFGEWAHVHSVRGSNATHYDDQHLPLFTTYRYRLTVYNDFAFTISPSSLEVATFGGVPLRSADVSAQALNHTSMLVNWTLPCEYIYCAILYYLGSFVCKSWKLKYAEVLLVFWTSTKKIYPQVLMQCSDIKYSASPK